MASSKLSKVSTISSLPGKTCSTPRCTRTTNLPRSSMIWSAVSLKCPRPRFLRLSTTFSPRLRPKAAYYDFIPKTSTVSTSSSLRSQLKFRCQEKRHGLKLSSSMVAWRRWFARNATRYPTSTQNSSMDQIRPLVAIVLKLMMSVPITPANAVTASGGSDHVWFCTTSTILTKTPSDR